MEESFVQLLMTRGKNLTDDVVQLPTSCRYC
jgi:hypothetical protein